LSSSWCGQTLSGSADTVYDPAGVLIRRKPLPGGNDRERSAGLQRQAAPASRASAGRAGAAAAALLGALTLAACGSALNTSTSSPAPVAAKVGAAATTATGSRTAQTDQATESGQLAPTACVTSQLTLAYTGTQGATGHVEATFALHNVSGHSCTLHGYPGAALLDGAGHTLPTQLKQGKGFFPDTLLVPRQVILRPGGDARFGLGFADNNEYVGGRPCRSAAWLKSVPPHAAGALRVALTGGEHPRFAPCGGQLVVSPIYAG
jgi:hypothetical protein